MTSRFETTLTRPSDRELVLTRSFAAPRALVWAAWTDPAQLARWYGPNGFTFTTSDFNPVVGGLWRFTFHGPDGRNYKNLIRYLDIIPEEKLVYRHTGEEESENIKFQTTVTLEENSGITTLTMRMEFEQAEILEFVIKNHGADEGGKQTLSRLAALVDNLTSDQPEFIITRYFNAPRALVWKAWTTAEMLTQWFGPKGCTGAMKKFDLREGGIWHSFMRTADGTEMWGKFVFQKVKPLERLEWLHSFSDADGNLTRHPLSADWPLILYTTVRFEDAPGGKTKLTLQWTPHNASEKERAVFVSAMAGMNGGWGGSFDQLEAFLLTQKPA